MLTKVFPKLQNNKILSFINNVLASPIYIAFVALLLTLSSVFPVGFTFYYVLIATSVIIPSLLCKDMTALIPLMTMINIGISKQLRDSNEQVLLGGNLPHMIIILTLVIIFAFGRLIFDLITEKERKKQYPRFLIGYIAILFAFLFAGRLYPEHTINDVTFGLREFLALGGMYFFYFYTVDMKNMKKNYFAYLLFFFAFAVASQILIESIRSGIDKPLLVGWANRSGLGGTLVACFTGCVYFIIKYKARISWIFSVSFLFFLTMIDLTQCRGAALTASILAIVCFVLVMIFTNKYTRIVTGSISAVYITSLVLFYIFQKEIFEECFGRLLDFDFDTIDKFSSGRITIWKKGLDQFIHYPIFGVGWYQIPNLGFPARYHNTLIQLLAATGIFGTLCYGFHRFETIYVTFKKPTLEKTFAFISISAILISSLLDCFLFNIWLGFLYSFLLLYVEKQNVITK